MSDDIHETVPANLTKQSAIGDETDSVQRSDSASSQSLAKLEEIIESDLSENPVQFLSDQQDCDVEEVLQRTVNRVVTFVQGTLDPMECVTLSAEPALESEATPESGTIENMIPETSDNLHDPRNVYDDGDDGEKPDNLEPEDTDIEAATHDENGGDVDDGDADEDEFGDFGDFSNARAVENSVVTNGEFEPVDANVINVDFNCEKRDGATHDDDDDDFGDFEEAEFGKPAADGPAIEFARFDDSPVNSGGNFVSGDSVAPVSPESFRDLITKLFAVVDNASNDLIDRPVESGNFHACVHRDIARCEDVDNWPCVLFRYDSSRTRKTLLTSLCIDETPVNCPRFAIDCLSNEFLQPVKESKTVDGLSTPGQGRELSEKAKEVLNKIPDLSFMKAEVLTFPATVQAP